MLFGAVRAGAARPAQAFASARRRIASSVPPTSWSAWSVWVVCRLSVTIEPDGDGSMGTLSLHTSPTDHADQDVGGTLDAIRRLAEAKA